MHNALPDIENMPALFIKTCNGPWRASQADANDFTDDNERRLSSITFANAAIKAMLLSITQ